MKYYLLIVFTRLRRFIGSFAAGGAAVVETTVIPRHSPEECDPL
jgi:hypothetical protein